MPKFFVTQDKISDNQIIIDSEDVTHISRVLRLEKGDNVTVCDGQGTDYDAQIDTIEPKKILFEYHIKTKERNRAEYKGYTFSGTSKSVQNGVHHSENNGAGHIRNCACETFKMCCENRQ